MSYEILSAIQEAEGKAEGMRKDAIAKARAIMDDAEAESVRLAAELLEKAEDAAQARIAQSHDAAKDAVDEIAQKAQREEQKLREIASERMERAVSAVVERIVTA